MSELNEEIVNGIVTMGGPRCEDPTHRSYSGDRHWDECQFRSYAINSGLVEDEYGLAATVGSAVDDAVKDTLLGREWDMAKWLTFHAKRQHVRAEAADRDKALKKAELLYRLWDREVRPDWEGRGIYGLEWELHFPIDRITYHVHIDGVFRDGSIVDLKTSETRINVDRIHEDVQLTTYATAVWLIFGQIAPQVILDQLTYTNPPADVAEWRKEAGLPAAEKPWWDRQASRRSIDQMTAFIDDVRRREASRRFALTTGVHQTQGRSSRYACNKCPAKPLCPSWKGWDMERSARAA